MKYVCGYPLCNITPIMEKGGIIRKADGLGRLMGRRIWETDGGRIDWGG